MEISDIDKLREDYERMENRLERVNEKLLVSEKIKSDFLSNIKNEINNPLTSIMGLLKQMIAEPDGQKNASRTKLIFNEVHALDFQMRNIFNAAEIEAGQLYRELSNFNLLELINALTKSFEHLSSKKDITFNVDIKFEETIISDREKIELILSNLISNAIKFSHEHSQILVRADINDLKQLIIEIEDFGVGIAESDMGRIHDRFKQLDSGTRKGFGGHGLGLSVAHSLLDLMDGSMRIESEVGEGSNFKVIVPIGSQDESQLDEDDEIFFGQEEKGEIF